MNIQYPVNDYALRELNSLRRRELVREAEEERLLRKVQSNRPAAAPLVSAIVAIASLVIAIITP